MTVINTNVGALKARVANFAAQTNMEKAMERLSSGLQINSASDDAAGLAVATKMESQIRGVNMAIRNSNDGISLVQTAESGMAEISNMVIRMRELSVQMANGIYSDGDRTNAQLEVDALLAEINKISENTAFNGVKVLDGSYDSEIRAGNTNAEVVNIQVERMHTDSLGGTAITTRSDAAVDTSATFVHTAAKTLINVQEGQVQVSKDVFSQGFKDFVIANAAGTYAVSTTDDGALFQVDQTTGGISLKETTGELDFNTARDLNFDGVYEFSVTYTVGSESVTEHVKLTVTDTATKTSAANTGTTNLTVEEAENVQFETVGVNGVLSDAFKEFVASDTGTGTFALVAGDDADHNGSTTAGDFTVNSATGLITAKTGRLDFENPNDVGGTNHDNSYLITMTYTSSTNKVYTETINIDVTDNATEDAGSVAIASERAHIGRSAIQLSQDDSTNHLDFSVSTVQDMLSSGAKEFIARHGGTAAAGNVFGLLAISSETMTGGAAANVGAIATGNEFGIDTNVAATADDLNTANEVRLGVGDDSGNGVITLTLTLSNATDQTAATTELFTETIVVSVTDNHAAGTGNYTQDSTGATEQGGAISTYTGTSNGEAVTLNLGDRTIFADLVAYTEIAGNSGGSYALFDFDGNPYTKAADGIANAEAGSNTDAKGYELVGSTLTLDAGADAGQYKARVVYTDLGGNTFTQQIDLTTTAAAHPSTASVSQKSTDQLKDGITASTEVVGGKSVLNVNEAMEATIQVSGGSGVLSPELGTFQTSYAKGTFSLSGADAADFEVSKTGDITSKVIMNFEDKAQYNFNLVYSQGDNVYTETIQLNVVNSTADDGNHIANVNITSQAGALEAISILDTALNSITAAQAKLGSTQNRLQHNIDNLTALSSQTETAKGRITDADYAAETSQLSKQQILSQAATSMLAQANQSKQSVLALLQ